MRLTWKAGRRDGPSRTAFAAGFLGTAVMLAATTLSVGHSVAGLGERIVLRVRATYESITFASTTRAPQPAGVTSRRPRMVTGADIRPATVTPAELLHEADPSSAPGRDATPGPLRDPDPRLLTPVPRGYRAELRLPAFSVTRELTAGQRDSALGAMDASVRELARHLEPTKEQRDSAQREIARRFADARDQHRPVAVPLGGVSVPAGFLGGRGYRSPEQRRRDSIVHRGNLRRLAILAERARAKVRQDSMRRADSIASLRTQKGDSTDE